MTLRNVIAALGALSAAALLGATGALAQQAGTAATDLTLSKSYTETIDVNVTNDVAVTIEKQLSVRKDVTIIGAVVIEGIIDVNESAIATIDNKQIVDDDSVTLTLDGFSSNLGTVGANVLQGATGNIGLNVSSGDNILQENAATLAAIGKLSVGGASDAEIFSTQKTTNNVYDPSLGDLVNKSEILGNVLKSASGNIGVNVATGAFHAQKNALALASVTGAAVLAEATAVVLQQASFSDTTHTLTTNTVSLGDSVLELATGNIGLNITAGGGNLQQNSLAISAVQ